MRPEIPEGTTSRNWLLALGALAAAKAVGLIALMSALAAALAQAASGAAVDTAALAWWGISGALLRAGSAWGTRVVAQRAALGVKESLRAQLVARRLAAGGGPGEAEEAALASRGLDGLDPYFRDYLPALVASAVIPLAIGARILAADWVSALILVLTIPLVPIFMILIGLHTAERVGEAQAGLDRLGRHLSELARGLPVLVGLRRAHQQRAALADVSERHRASTMSTLRTAFLSAFALELIATLSVAVVAVFIGVRLVGGSIGLEAGLIALMLAPDCFLPLRELGSAHHASEDGVAALRRVRAALQAPVRAELASAQPGDVLPDDAGPGLAPDAAGQRGAVRLRGLRVTRGDGRGGVGPIDVDPRAGAITALLGPSGCGKSSVLEVLAGLLRPAPRGGEATPADTSDVTGSLSGLDPERRAYIAQAPAFASGTARAELELAGAADPFLELGELLPARLWDAPLERLSPGERRRVAVARAAARTRALLAADAKTPAATRAPVVLLADEPTAHLDPVSAQRVRLLLERLAGLGACVVLATHDELLASRADVRVRFSAAAPVRALAAEPGTPQLPPLQAGKDPAARHEGARAAGSEDVDAAADADSSRTTRAPRGAWRLLPLTSPRLWLSIGLGALSVLAAAALSGLSGWLIVKASTQPHMMYLMTAIVGVRAFGLARAVLRYRERLATHDVVLRWSARLRVRLWDALGADARGWSRLTRPGGALSTLVAQVDELRDALPRVLVPVPAAILAALGTLVAVGIFAPAALPVAAVAAALGLLAVPALVLILERSAAAHAAQHRAQVALNTGRVMAAAPDLSANGLAAAQLRAYEAQDAAGARELRRDAFGSGAGRAAATLVASLAALVAILVAAPSTAPELLALSVLLLLALDEPLGQLADALRNAPVVGSMLRALAPWLLAPKGGAEAEDQAEDTGAPRTDLEALEVTDLSAGYDPARPAVFSGVSAQASPGEAWAVSGPSGSGKSTLVATLLGFLAPRTGRVRAKGHEGWSTLVSAEAGEMLDGAARRGIAWCPQDGYVFDSSLRGNLALARDREHPPSEEEMLTSLHRVGLREWFEELPEGLDTLTGPAGDRLSGGQRQRLAVARTLLSGAGVVVLDEPTAHLGVHEGSELVDDVLGGAAGTTLVLVTHDAALADRAQHRTVLGEDAREGVGSAG